MSIETEQDLEGMTEVGRLVRLALRQMEAAVRPGITTAELDQIGAKILTQHGARSAPQLFYNFPGVNCISLNDEAVHGIPGARAVQPGDLVKLDVTAELNGYIADAAITVMVPPISPTNRRLCNSARAALQQALAIAQAGHLVSRIGRAVETKVRQDGFAIMPELSGHGVGRAIHEAPSVPNFYDPNRMERLTEGLVITIEPIISAGSGKTIDSDDGWTVRTADGSPSAHYEHTIIITKHRPVVLTA